MGLFNSEVMDVRDGFVVVDIGRQWTIDLTRWLQIPGSKIPQAGQYWAIEVSSVDSLIAGELPSQMQRTNDALDGMDNYFAACYGGR